MPAPSFLTVLAAEHLPADELREHGGRVVGDDSTGVTAVFVSAVAAVGAAVALQRTAATPGRIGIDGGELVDDGAALSGRPLLVAERLRDAAQPGEIVVSDVVRQIVGPSVEQAIVPGERMRFAGLAEPVLTAAVRWREAAAAPAVAAPITVVIADDQRPVRSGLRIILEAEPDIAVIGEAENGREAVSVVARRRPDVALLDIRMPELDGLSAAEQILADPDRRTAVLMLTTFDASEYVFRALRAGASGFLLKDAPADRLTDAVRVAAAGDALIAPSITRRLIGDFTRAARPSADALPAILAPLTPREVEVLRLIARGLSNAEIAAELVLGENTVKTHVARMLGKLGLRDRVQAVVLAYEAGLVVPTG